MDKLICVSLSLSAGSSLSVPNFAPTNSPKSNFPINQHHARARLMSTSSSARATRFTCNIVARLTSNSCFAFNQAPLKLPFHYHYDSAHVNLIKRLVLPKVNVELSAAMLRGRLETVFLSLFVTVCDALGRKRTETKCQLSS
jgi:hypothetical protein